MTERVCFFFTDRLYFQFRVFSFMFSQSLAIRRCETILKLVRVVSNESGRFLFFFNGLFNASPEVTLRDSAYRS